MSLYVHVCNNFSAAFISIFTLGHDLGKLFNKDWMRVDTHKAWFAAVGTDYSIVTGYELADVVFDASLTKALATLATLFRLNHNSFAKDTIKKRIVRPTCFPRSYLNLASHQCGFL